MDRLSRDQEDIAAIHKRIAHRAKLVTVAEGEVGMLHVGLKGTMNAARSRLLRLPGDPAKVAELALKR